MTIKRIIYRGYIRLLEKLCLIKSARNCFKANLLLQPLPDGNKNTDIVTIAFNNDKIIPIHVRYMKKYFLDEHTHIIADNSTDKVISDRIKEYCLEEGVPYIRLPKNYHNGSRSHATAMNWVSKHIIGIRRPAFFGFTDHDLFPIKPVSLMKILRDQHVYGPIRVRGGGKYWYISAIYCFFDFEYVKNKGLDFMPARYDSDKNNYLDTGGGNWPRIYSNMDRTNMIFCDERVVKVGEGNDRHNDYVELFDNNFLHTINGAERQYATENAHLSKTYMLQKLIDQFECEC